MIKERFALPVLLALSSAQCVTHFGAYYHNSFAQSSEWNFGLFHALLSVALLIFIVPTQIALWDNPDKDVWLTTCQYRLLVILNGFVALLIALQLWGRMGEVALSTLPPWLRIASYVSLFLAIWISSCLWAAFVRARRVIRERGYAPQEVTNEMA